MAATNVKNGKILLWKYVKDYKSLLVLVLVLAAINQVFSLLDPLIFRYVVDNYAMRVAELTQAEFIRGVLILVGGMIAVAFNKIAYINGRPIGEEQVIVVGVFSDCPHIKGFVHHQNSHAVAEI